MSSETTSAVELAKIRCSISQIKSFQLPAEYGSDLTIGTLVQVGDCVCIPLKAVDVSAASEIAVAAYEIPAIVVPCRGAAIGVGAALGHVLASSIWAENDSNLTVFAHCIEEKAAGPSEVLVHFDGRGKQIWKGSISSLIVTLDMAV